jgi:NADPH:quinone reductase-like Zn-dependent oxidoreductase
VCVPADRAVAPKPANVSFEEAGVVAIAGVTALQGLRDKGGLKAGDKVLITGASGGVGTFAVQIAKALAADVTAVCRTSNVELVRSLGADRVIDYTREDFTRSGERYDILLDIANTRSWADSRRVLKANGTMVLVGAPAHGRALGPLGRIVRMFVAGKLRGSQKVVFFVARITKDDMDVLRELIDSGKVKPVVEHRFPLERVAEALERIGTGHTRGKIAITM